MAETQLAIPTKPVTILSARADMTVSDEKVALDAVLGEDFKLQLTKEAFIGSPMSVAYWLKETYAVEGDGIDWLTIPYEYEDSAAFARAYKAFKADPKKVTDRDLYKKIKIHLEARKLPKEAMVMMTTAMLAEVSITDLLIQIKDQGKDKKIMFGLAIYFRAPLPLLPNVNVDKLTFLLKHSSTGNFADFPTRAAELGPPAAALPGKIAAGSIKFTKQPTSSDQITLGTTSWGFVTGRSDKSDVAKKITKVGGDIAATVTELVANLTVSKDDSIGKCTYKAISSKTGGDIDTLSIEYKEDGTAGNDFQLNVAGDFGEASASTLRGGGGAPDNRVDKQSTGFIKFIDLPEENKKIKLNGLDWTFVKDASGTGKTKIGAVPDLAKQDIAKSLAIIATVKKLAQDLGGSADGKLTVASYTASGKTLKIEYTGEIPAGNTFTLACEKNTGNTEFAKLSGPTLTGGESAIAAKSSGSIKFKKKPAPNDTIKLGGNDWKFVSAAPSQGAAETQIGDGDTLADTVKSLVNDLNKSKTDPFNKCTYSATKSDAAGSFDTLTVEYNTIGKAGDQFKLEAGTPATTLVDVTDMKGGED